MRVRSEPTRSKAEAGGQRGRWTILRGAEGAQLLEFALATPLLVVLLVGISDFGTAYNLKQKLNNAAREGARIAIGQSRADLDQAVPLTVQAVRNAVVAYLTNASVDTSFISTTPTKTGPRQWTYYSTTSGAPILVIDRSYIVPVTVGGATTIAVSTKVTLSYPYGWSFNRIIQLLVPSASNPSSIVISTDAVMKNLT